MPPPPLDESSEFYKIIMDDPRYASEPSKEEFPLFESLKLTIQRTLPYWNDVIVPQIKAGKNILIAAHGNSLRGIVKHLEGKNEQLGSPSSSGFHLFSSSFGGSDLGCCFFQPSSTFDVT